MTQSQHDRPHTYPAYAPPARTKKARRWPWVVGIVAAFLVGIGVGSAGGNGAAPATAARGVDSYPPSVVEPQTPEVGLSNGVYEIGTDVEPGKYLSSGAEEGGFQLCYVDVQRGNKYLLQEVVPEGQVRITLDQSWVGASLKISGCQPFAKVD